MSEINNTNNTRKKGYKTLAIVLSLALLAGISGGIGYEYERNQIKNKNNSELDLNSSANKSSAIKKVSLVTNNSDYDLSEVVENTMPSIVAVTCSQYISNSADSFFDYFYNYDNRNDQGREGNTFSAFGKGENDEFTEKKDNKENKDNDEEDSNLQESSAGSGIIIGQDSKKVYIVTNYHVIADADSVKLTFNDESELKCEVTGYNEASDLAVLEVNISDIPQKTLKNIKIASIGSSESVDEGESVIAIGNALGYGQSVTTGIVSASSRIVQLSDTAMNLIQTDAAINPGNSGGALLNASGQLIGINSAKYAADDVEGMGFAIPISDAVPKIEAIINSTDLDASSNEGYLGVIGADVENTYQNIYGMPAGVYISQVDKDSPAEKAGLYQGMIITEFDGKSVTSMEVLSALIKAHKPNDTVTMTVKVANMGKYEEQKVTVTLGSSSQANTGYNN
ncbi:serine protease, S1-C subfamily, contains C-terminal PDZ domain [Acetitomaculum ruminis DSM 5522]|uniref:Serine protease, S1-C subfamily, contains C-terminal PDZ domain n=1 Tax=Acetitomaculum ruminis DSM 5522 TaxID=1120918 RepID=A0A1I1ADE0_9FIRM|nr:trypsin-like peptidase domain-containing protein [Acetitomaculum ruminis]SFB36004.1 serine protease, S1-C subfamily, contains C-terminal PDZ domain [Acetitomaculum ruminis DSM 5522]